MSERPILLKLLLRDRHWQNYGTFCAQYDQAAARVDPGLAGSCPSRAQLHRWLTGALRSLPYPDHCRVLEEMLPGWSAEQLFQPAVPGLLQPGGRSPGQPVIPDVPGPPVFAAPSVGLRPFIEQAFTREHVTIDFAGFSGETLHGGPGTPRQDPHRPDQARDGDDTSAAPRHQPPHGAALPGR